MTRWRTHPASLTAAEVRTGDQVALLQLSTDGSIRSAWWPVGHVFRDPWLGTIELDLLGTEPLEVPAHTVLTVRWPVGAGAGRPVPTPRWTRQSRSSAAPSPTPR